MKPLGLMEMEFNDLPMSPKDLQEWAVNVAGYLIDRGSPIPHNDTLSASADQVLRVTHGPSRFG